MKKMISNFGNAVLSREQMKGVKGGTEDVEPGDGPGSCGMCISKRPCVSVAGNCVCQFEPMGCNGQ